jgi:hypothetical protein
MGGNNGRESLVQEPRIVNEKIPLKRSNPNQMRHKNNDINRQDAGEASAQRRAVGGGG